jgi:hypothetical protein
MSDFLEEIILPESFKPLFIGISHYLINLNYKWRFYQELFLEKDNSLILMHTAPMFFFAIEQSLRNDIILSICRLSDPERVKNDVNLSLATLINNTEPINKVNDLYEEFKENSKFFRKCRNKLIAHNDLEVFNDKSILIPLLDKEKVDKSLLLSEKILNLIAQRYNKNTQILFSLLFIGGVDSLLHWLSMGIKYHQENIALLKKGIIPPYFNKQQIG